MWTENEMVTKFNRTATHKKYFLDNSCKFNY